MADSLTKHWKIILLVLSLIILVPLAIFIMAFHHLPWGKPSDFADFAVYYSSMVMPALTLTTVVVLYFTFKSQNDALVKQSQYIDYQVRHQLLMAHIARFDKQLDKFNSEKSKPFFVSDEGQMYFDDITLNPLKHSNCYKAISLRKRMPDLLNQDYSLDNHDKDVVLYFMNLKLYAASVFGTLYRIYALGTADEEELIYEIYIQAKSIFTQLDSWNVFNEKEISLHQQTIELPKYSRKG